jgi:hypothetical protein
MAKKILLACPTSDYKLYCQDEWLSHISKLTYPVDILIVENSRKISNSYKLKGLGYNVVHVKPKNTLGKTLSHCSNIIREYAIRNEYDYLFSLESDQFPPYNIIEILLSYDKAVIGSPYLHFEGSKTTVLRNTYINIGGVHFGDYTSLMQSFMEMDGGLLRAEQCGIGCMLIKIDVLKHIRFRIGVPGEYGYFNEGLPDYYFHLDLQKNKIPVWLVSYAMSEHKNSSKRWKAILNKEKIN